jgi:hypothetical protein
VSREAPVADFITLLRVQPGIGVHHGVVPRRHIAGLHFFRNRFQLLQLLFAGIAPPFREVQLAPPFTHIACRQL